MTAETRSVAVFCGRSLGRADGYRRSAEALGTGLADAGARLVFGGGAHGMMATVADAALTAGGPVLGIIPRFLIELEGIHPRAQQIVETETLHERKKAMYDAADGFAVLPGGLGTIDETIEIITWRQVHLHDKPIVVVNIDGWADLLIATMREALHQGFVDTDLPELFEVVPDVETALTKLVPS